MCWLRAWSDQFEHAPPSRCAEHDVVCVVLQIHPVTVPIAWGGGVYVFVRVCVRERGRERGRVCVCVCVCVRERERERLCSELEIAAYTKDDS